MRENTAGNIIAHHCFDVFKIFTRYQLLQISAFSPSEQLYPFISKRIKKAGKRKTGPVKVGNGNRTHQTFLSADTVKMERLMLR